MSLKVIVLELTWARIQCQSCREAASAGVGRGLSVLAAQAWESVSKAEDCLRDPHPGEAETRGSQGFSGWPV